MDQTRLPSAGSLCQFGRALCPILDELYAVYSSWHHDIVDNVADLTRKTLKGGPLLERLLSGRRTTTR